MKSFLKSLVFLGTIFLLLKVYVYIVEHQEAAASERENASMMTSPSSAH